jgi:hypothetical protein
MASCVVVTGCSMNKRREALLQYLAVLIPETIVVE